MIAWRRERKTKRQALVWASRAENKHVFQGLTCGYISDPFEAKQAELNKQRLHSPDPEAPNEYRTVSINRVESRTLDAPRDTLLPKVVCGELQVKDTERCAEFRG